MLIGNAAGLGGDIPYSQAVVASIANPIFDTQLSVYTRLLAVPDTAIANIKGARLGPAGDDPWDRGKKKPRWEISAAPTRPVKPRFHGPPPHTSRSARRPQRTAKEHT